MSSTSSGGATPSRKRATDREGDAEPRPASKRSARSSVDDLVCPITLELPYDPVTAEDGRVYDRPAITEHLENHPTDLKSPVTNEPMGRLLLPALQVRNHIETLVENGVIKGDLAIRWEKRRHDRETLERNRKAAENGDADAMCFMADAYYKGEYGLRVNEELAFSWHRKSRKAGSSYGRTMEGLFLYLGIGTERNLALGVMLLTSAAERGSKQAAYALGRFLTGEFDGCLHDEWEATHFLGGAVDKNDHSSPEPLAGHFGVDIEDVQSLLQQLLLGS